MRLLIAVWIFFNLDGLIFYTITYHCMGELFRDKLGILGFSMCYVRFLLLQYVTVLIPHVSFLMLYKVTSTKCNGSNTICNYTSTICTLLMLYYYTLMKRYKGPFSPSPPPPLPIPLRMFLVWACASRTKTGFYKLI